MQRIKRFYFLWVSMGGGCMTLDEVILLEKQIDLLKDRTQIIFAEG